MDDRPVVQCFVAWPLPNGDHIIRLVPLDRAVDFKRFGWHVLVDPADESALARWEQVHRSRLFFRKGPH